MSLDIDIAENSRNYTHNVTPMWELAGVYDALYMSDGKRAGDFIQVLTDGVEHMASHPVEYEKLNPDNGWGEYRSALNFLIDVLNDAVRNPDAVISISK